jgi:hypothetical protein
MSGIPTPKVLPSDSSSLICTGARAGEELAEAVALADALLEDGAVPLAELLAEALGLLDPGEQAASMTARPVTTITTAEKRRDKAKEREVVTGTR